MPFGYEHVAVATELHALARWPSLTATLSRGELAGLDAHNALDSALVDALQWETRIQTVRGDSLDCRLGA